MIGAVAQKLIEQVAVGRVHLDAIEARLERIFGSVTVLIDKAGQFAQLECARRRMLDATERRVRPALRRHEPRARPATVRRAARKHGSSVRHAKAA